MISKYFEVQITADNSPTLALSNASGDKEAMHNSRGAFSETCYVYGPAIDFAFSLAQTHKPIHFVSVGLGLGYVEMLIVARYLKLSTKPSFTVESFESVPMLRSSFQNWLENGDDPIYTSIAERFEQQHSLRGGTLRQMLYELVKTDALQILSNYTATTTFRSAPQAILFDAFSKTLSPDLWTSECLQHLAQSAHTTCAFATYASTLTLKRTLTSNGFKLEKREGFSGKRECTLAYREVQSDGSQ